MAIVSLLDYSLEVEINELLNSMEENLISISDTEDIFSICEYYGV